MIISKIYRVDLVGRDDYIPPAKPRGIDPADTNLKIHPTAIVGSSARLGENLEIGPYAIVEDGVTVGSDCVIQAHSVLTNKVTIGDRNVIGYGAVIGSPPQDLAHNDSISSGVVIGNDNVFREYVTIHRGSKEGTSTRVGHGNLLMAGVHLGHNVSIGDRNIFANNCLLAGYVDAADDIVLGGASVFHQFLRIGAMCMIRGGTAWSKDIPPFTVGAIINRVCGINAIGMKRKGIGTENRANVKRAYKLLYRSGLNVTQAIDAGQSEDWTREGKMFMDFVGRRTKRGLCAAQSEEPIGTH
ncbi:UDP-N-acetylglucosamine acyltransferase [Terrimicrobium sacchariphilum]|uniref:UDP-N-acetylglucosamine acyltransferase n=1 Tax=Terrimicrobium sacchariphilum TaxID=690879 RepID=A0A146G763_TERSA|nr:UDP-N-acetylglucosamine acyltransferase [Terrimicrobium sacchariphilum]